MSEATGATGDTSAPDGEVPTRLNRVIGPKLLFFFVIGDILGTGIYALTGSVAGEIGGALWVPFLGAFVVAFLTAFSYLELVGKFPRAAGAALYVNQAFGMAFLTFIVASGWPRWARARVSRTGSPRSTLPSPGSCWRSPRPPRWPSSPWSASRTR